MNRLTNKSDFDIYCGCSEHRQMVEKLMQLEDIEEEIGIDLITLFKALKNGVYVKDDLYGIEYRQVRGIEENGISAMSRICTYPECDETYYYKDYGKTWTMTKEELEND